MTFALQSPAERLPPNMHTRLSRLLTIDWHSHCRCKTPGLAKQESIHFNVAAFLLPSDEAASLVLGHVHMVPSRRSLFLCAIRVSHACVMLQGYLLPYFEIHGLRIGVLLCDATRPADNLTYPFPCPRTG